MINTAPTTSLHERMLLRVERGQSGRHRNAKLAVDRLLLLRE
jgi:hypothetical protein